MEFAKKRSAIVLKRIGTFLGTILFLFLIFKLSIYFMPFFIATLIALLIEKPIKFCMNKFKMTRRIASSVVISITIISIIALVIWGSLFIVGELVNFSKDIGPLITDISMTFENKFNEISYVLSRYVPEEVFKMIMTSITEFVSNTGNYVQDILSKIVGVVLSFPTILLNVIVTILSLIFLTKDKIYIIDMIEHHFPKKWTKNVIKITKEVFSTLANYLKVYGKILLVTFVELFLAFSILTAIGFEINNIFIISIVTALVDILPIFGVGTILIPWSLWQFILGNTRFGFALSIVYIIILIIRQLIEPKLVSKQLGVHPLITLIAMYAGFKMFGFTGLITGPIILLILQCVFAKPIEKGWGRWLNGT